MVLYTSAGRGSGLGINVQRVLYYIRFSIFYVPIWILGR